MSPLEGVTEQINLRLEDMNGRMTSLENSLNASMTALETRMKSVEMRMNVHIALLLLLWATVIVALLVMLFRG